MKLRIVAAFVLLVLGRAATLFALLCALPVAAHGQQVPATKSEWHYIYYPPVIVPGIANRELSFILSHNGGQQDTLSGLGFTLSLSALNSNSTYKPFGDNGAVIVRLHTSDGKVVAAQRPPLYSAYIGGALGGAFYFAHFFPRSRNALDDAWIEVRAAVGTWWIELPYGFARNPGDLEVADANNGEPRFAAAMQPLGAKDILVPWLAVEYDFGLIHTGARLSLMISNSLGPRAIATLYREPTSQVGEEQRQRSMDLPREAIIETNSFNVIGAELDRHSEDSYRRSYDFTFGRPIAPATGRSFGAFSMKIDGQSYGARVPSSLFFYQHGRTDPSNKHWMVLPRECQARIPC